MGHVAGKWLIGLRQGIECDTEADVANILNSHSEDAVSWVALHVDPGKSVLFKNFVSIARYSVLVEAHCCHGYGYLLRCLVGDRPVLVWDAW